MHHLFLRIFKKSHFRKNLEIIFIIFIVYLTIGGNAMPERAEDQYYPNAGAGTPQAAREAFGEPELWMEWIENPYTAGGGGSYNGFHFQDKEKPFVLYGGGFDDESRYIGRYVSICLGGMPFIDETYILEGFYGDKNFIDFRAFPNHMFLSKKHGSEKLECLLYPTNWYDDLVDSERIKEDEYFRKYQYVLNLLKQKSKNMGYKIIVKTVEQDHIFAKITDKNNDYVKINFLLYGEGIDFAEEIRNIYDITFSIPDEVRPFYDEITFPLWDRYGDGYMILKNGLYLKRDP